MKQALSILTIAISACAAQQPQPADPSSTPENPTVVTEQHVGAAMVAGGVILGTVAGLSGSLRSRPCGACAALAGAGAGLATVGLMVTLDGSGNVTCEPASPAGSEGP